LNPIFTINSGKGKEAEIIRANVDQWPSGRVETSHYQVDEEGEETETKSWEIGLGHDDGAVAYSELDD
jgi:hypothetical protein